jgi:hypothetical protein
MKNDVISIKICHSAAYSMYFDQHDARFTANRSARHLTYFQNRPPYYQKFKYIIKPTLILSKTEIYYQIRKIGRHATYSRSPSPKTEKPAIQTAGFSINYETR